MNHIILELPAEQTRPCHLHDCLKRHFGDTVSVMREYGNHKRVCTADTRRRAALEVSFVSMRTADKAIDEDLEGAASGDGVLETVVDARDIANTERRTCQEQRLCRL